MINPYYNRPDAVRKALLWAWTSAKEECSQAADPQLRNEMRRHRAVLHRLLVQAEMAAAMPDTDQHDEIAHSRERI
jgi:hypothetical protein